MHLQTLKMGTLLVLFFGGLLTFASARDSDWFEGVNCPETRGNVTDALCCLGDNFCSRLYKENDCTADGDPFMYCEWVDDRCRPMEDSKSDVCCIDGNVKDACAAVFKGQCPEDWQVDEGCCSSADGQKYAFLKAEEGKVCCNAPCKEMEEAKCTNLPLKCAPTQRSYAMRNPYHQLGFHQDHRNPYHHKFGHILHGTGFGHDYGYGHRRYRPGKDGHKIIEEDDDYDYSKDQHVDEITMDDMFLLMIEALEKQTDVKIYDADITSDPYLGKKKAGGLFVDHRFPHADKIFDEIYGEKGQYEHFVRPYEGYEKLYPGYKIERHPHYQPYPDYGPYHHQPYYYGQPSYHSGGYQSYEPQSYYQPSPYHGGYGDHVW